MCILKAESNSDFNLKYRDKLEWFRRLSYNVNDKLQSLLHLSENYTCASNSLKQFVSRIDALRISVIKQVKPLYFTYPFCYSRIYKVKHVGL